MSIQFKSVRWRNFLSTGNNWTSVQLDKHRSTLIVGENGSGKSTMLDALSFGLFGKAHRNIKKDQLVNTINEKSTEVEVEFNVGRHSFRVFRSIKPNKFEIWQNGTMINQSSNSRDYQKYLEQSILKLNHKSFHQIVVLGSSSFIPFMQLPAHTRREVIEDLLDIQIFSKMNSILKEQLSILKEEIKEIDYSTSLTKEKITLQQRYIRDITEMNDGQIRKMGDEIAEYQREIGTLQARNSALSQSIKEKGDGVDERITELSQKREKVLGYKAQFEQQISSVVKEAKFYEESDNCPTCTQSIRDELREERLVSAKEKARELKEALDHAAEQSTTLESNIKNLREISAEVSESASEIHTNNLSIERLQKSIRDTEASVEELNGKDGDLSVANDELRRLKDEKESMTERKLGLMSSQTYKQAAYEMLKDSGIKTKIIKEYLPVMNNLVNKYLQVLDFFVSFHLDESFNESIRSRYRDAFNYASFSEGEKARIDLSLLFTWRQIARMKNSTSTNLLVLDETFDSSLDTDGVDNLMKILNTLDEDTNTFVISHKGDQLDGKFEHKMVARKEHNFSTLLSEE
jgi:DNA repair exonuclease SbcCD ATPase subunit